MVRERRRKRERGGEKERNIFNNNYIIIKGVAGHVLKSGAIYIHVYTCTQNINACLWLLNPL